MRFLPARNRWGRNSLRFQMHVALHWIKLPVTSSFLWASSVLSGLCWGRGVGGGLSGVQPCDQCYDLKGESVKSPWLISLENHLC